MAGLAPLGAADASTSIAYLGSLNYHRTSHVKIGFNAGAQHDQGPRGFSSLLLAHTMLSYQGVFGFACALRTNMACDSSPFNWRRSSSTRARVF